MMFNDHEHLMFPFGHRIFGVPADVTPEQHPGLVTPLDEAPAAHRTVLVGNEPEKVEWNCHASNHGTG